MRLKLFTALAMGICVLTSCQDEDFGYSAKDISYQKEFNSRFPNVDPNHNWCTVDTRALQVVTSQPSDIRVYNESGTQLLAHYYDVNGAESIVFDLELNARRVLVTDGNSVLKVGLDEVANFAVTRAAGPEDNLANVIDQNAGPCPYYLLFEDLGADPDFDFNDIVLKVEYTPSNEASTAKVSLMAAGGVLPFTVSYDGAELFTKEAFGAEFTEVPVNVSASNGVDGKDAIVTELNVPAYYSVARNLANFVVSVEGRTISATPHSLLPEDNTPRVIVFRNHGTDWGNESNARWTCSWPTEGQPIEDFYPQFQQWVSNHNDVNWPNYMSDGTGSDAVVYDTPYFYVKVEKLTLQAAVMRIVNNEPAEIDTPAESIHVEITPKDGYGGDKTVTAYLSTQALNPASTTKLATLSENYTVNEKGSYVYTITANSLPLPGEFNLNVTISGTDYSRPLSAALKLNVTARQTIVINTGDIDPGIDYTLALIRTAQTSDDTNVLTDKEYHKSTKYVVFYFDEYDFKLEGIKTEDYNQFEVVISVAGSNKFQAYSYTVNKNADNKDVWEINQDIKPESNSFTIPMDVFYTNIIETGLDRLMVVRAGTGGSSLPAVYNFMIREKK